MGINVGQAASQAGSLAEYASRLREIANELNRNKGALSQTWQSDEVSYIRLAIEQVAGGLLQTSSELQTLSSDIVSVANEIRQEELAREAAAREAAAREAAAREAARRAAAQAIIHPFGWDSQ